MDDATLSAGEFKATCLKLMDEVAASGREVIITKRGKPVARLVPIAPAPRESVFGAMAGMIEIVGDIVSPIGDFQVEATLAEWNELNAATKPRRRGGQTSA